MGELSGGVGVGYRRRDAHSDGGDGGDGWTTGRGDGRADVAAAGGHTAHAGLSARAAVAQDPGLRRDAGVRFSLPSV